MLDSSLSFLKTHASTKSEEEILDSKQLQGSASFVNIRQQTTFGFPKLSQTSSLLKGFNQIGKKSNSPVQSTSRHRTVLHGSNERAVEPIAKSVSPESFRGGFHQRRLDTHFELPFNVGSLALNADLSSRRSSNNLKAGEVTHL